MIYKLGSKGEMVKKIQEALHIKPDGFFGKETEYAVVAFQDKHGLATDGIVGEKTLALLFPTDEISITKGYIKTHITQSPNRPIKYIAIHYTAGATSKKGAALRTRNVFLNRRASADFVVDDELIVQINPELRNYYCWSVGDAKNKWTGGGRLHGQATNRNTVSIEICSTLRKGTSAAVPNHEGWTLSEAAVENARLLVRHLMQAYGIPKERVVRHYDISGKLCPGVPGWNDGPLYDTKGRQTSGKSGSQEWLAFWNSI